MAQRILMIFTVFLSNIHLNSNQCICEDIIDGKKNKLIERLEGVCPQFIQGQSWGGGGYIPISPREKLIIHRESIRLRIFAFVVGRS